VDFADRRAHPARHEPSPGASAPAERASPTYEPFHKEPEYQPGSGEHEACGYNHDAQHRAWPGGAAWEGRGQGGASGAGEWGWSTGRGEAGSNAEEQTRSCQARKARMQELDARVAQLREDEAREKRQRAERRKARFADRCGAHDCVLHCDAVGPASVRCASAGAQGSSVRLCSD
jgi:hypothetical protein